MDLRPPRISKCLRQPPENGFEYPESREFRFIEVGCSSASFCGLLKKELLFTKHLRNMGKFIGSDRLPKSPIEPLLTIGKGWSGLTHCNDHLPAVENVTEMLAWLDVWGIAALKYYRSTSMFVDPHELVVFVRVPQISVPKDAGEE